MKKYTTPQARFITLGAEHSLLLDTSNSVSTEDQLSNRRKKYSSASSAIWDSDGSWGY